MKFKELYFHSVVIATCTAFMSSLAFAETYNVQGTVTDVETVYATKTVTDPVQKCWTEEVPVYGQGKNNDSQVFGLDLEGAIIGGAIANNTMKGDNTGAMGAIIGGLIGSDMKAKKNKEITGYRQVQKCTTEYNSRTEEYVAGYKVWYSVFGLEGTTTKPQRPAVGSNINVTVNLQAR